MGADPPSPGLQGGVWGTPGGVCAPWVSQGDEHWRCWMSSLTVTAETGTSRQNVAMGCSVNVFKIKKGRLNPNYWYEGKIKWLSVGTDGQTAQPNLPSLHLPCSKKRCFVDLGWFCFAWLFPSGCIFFAGTFFGHAGNREQSLCPFLPGKYLLVDALHRILLGFKYICGYIYTQSLNYWALQAEFMSSLAGVQGWEGEVCAQWPEGFKGISGAQISGLAAAWVQFDPR